ncbi:hypothetical protein AC579_4085 [Pseudocercospora musae]|uniref:Uncharacterized protein n=1 Tax=Pseudocercospora musae TaxID=113226 RepID=A0A139IJH9_9PEZI|nr:hypothetical protein AC579_4085 [Pseudocercospora musae]
MAGNVVKIIVIASQPYLWLMNRHGDASARTESSDCRFSQAEPPITCLETPLAKSAMLALRLTTCAKRKGGLSVSLVSSYARLRTAHFTSPQLGRQTRQKKAELCRNEAVMSFLPPSKSLRWNCLHEIVPSFPGDGCKHASGLQLGCQCRTTRWFAIQLSLLQTPCNDSEAIAIPQTNSSGIVQQPTQAPIEFCSAYFSRSDIFPQP